MGRKELIELLVEGGKAAPGASTAPKLSAMKLNVQDIFKQINDKTKSYAGMQVPVKIEIDTDTKEFEITIGTPPVSSLIKKELGIELAKITEEEKAGGKTSVGDLKMDQVVKIANMKKDSLLAKDMKAAVKQILGTAASMPVTVEGRKSKELISEVDEGKFDQIING